MDVQTWAGHTLFNIGFWTFFWGAFELAYQSPSHPIWSGTFGPPIMHHYIVGAILVYIGYILITFDKEIRAMVKDMVRRKVRRESAH